MNKVDELIDTLSFNIQEEWNTKLEGNQRFEMTTPSGIKVALLYYCVTWTDGMIDDEDELRLEKFIIKRWNKLTTKEKAIAKELFDEFDNRCAYLEGIKHESKTIHNHRTFTAESIGSGCA